MAQSPTDEGSTKGNGEERNGLTRIRGIGSTKRQWLELLGIRNVHDLATASADEIESRLRVAGHSVTRSEIAGWIAQAQEFTAELPSQQIPDYPHSPSEKQEAFRQAEESMKLKPEENLPASVKEGEWRTFASFMVECQSKQTEDRAEQRTIVRHIETDTVRIWSGIESDFLQEGFASQFQQWIVAQAGTGMQPQSEPEELALTSPLVSEIVELRIFQPPRTELLVVIDRVRQGFFGTLRQGESFSLEIDFKLTGLNRANIATNKTIRYCTQVYARHRSTGAIAHLGDTEATIFVQEQPLYTALISEASLHQSGLYRLQVLLTFQEALIPPNIFEVSMLQVI